MCVIAKKLKHRISPKANGSMVEYTVWVHTTQQKEGIYPDTHVGKVSRAPCRMKSQSQRSHSLLFLSDIFLVTNYKDREQITSRQKLRMMGRERVDVTTEREALKDTLWWCSAGYARLFTWRGEQGLHVYCTHAKPQVQWHQDEPPLSHSCFWLEETHSGPFCTTLQLPEKNL